jgi:hypothetical protein
MNDSVTIITEIEALLGKLKELLGQSTSKAESRQKPEKSAAKFSGLAGSIHDLLAEGFFKEGKTISEIQAKLRLEGISQPTTAISGPLLMLIREKILSRSKPEGGKGAFRYQQR